MRNHPNRTHPTGTLQILKQAGNDFSEDDAMTLGAALAFYSALSFAPLLILALWVVSLLGEARQEQLMNQIAGMIGGEGSNAVRMIVESSAKKPQVGTIAGIIGLVTLLFSAAGVFAQLQHALNTIWDVKPKPGAGLWGWIRKRILSLGMVLTILFLLLVSLALTAALSFMLAGMRDLLPGADALWYVLSVVVSVLVITLLFAMMFKFLPDVKIPWRVVWLGALATAVLFELGKQLIGLYLGRSSVGSAYGAAGSMIVLLVWVYYSSLIFFFGAELTQAWAQAHGQHIVPDEHAMHEDQQYGGATPHPA